MLIPAQNQPQHVDTDRGQALRGGVAEDAQTEAAGVRAGLASKPSRVRFATPDAHVQLPSATPAPGQGSICSASAGELCQLHVWTQARLVGPAGLLQLSVQRPACLLPPVDLATRCSASTGLSFALKLCSSSIAQRKLTACCWTAVQAQPPSCALAPLLVCTPPMHQPWAGV